MQSVLLYGSETWAMKAEDEGRLQRAENAMVRWMCGVTLRDRTSTLDGMKRLDVEKVVDMVRSRLRWFGHVERKEECDWVSACRNIKVAGSRSRGRPKKAWMEFVDNEMSVLRLKREMTKDRDLWRGAIHGKPSNLC